MFWFIKKIFIRLLASIVSAFNHTKWVSLSNQKYLTQLTLINLHPNEDSQKLYYHPIAVNLDRCFISCNTLNPNPNLGVVGEGVILLPILVAFPIITQKK